MYVCMPAATAVIVGDSTRQRAIPLAILITKKQALDFHNFYACLVFVSPISIGMGLRHG